MNDLYLAGHYLAQPNEIQNTKSDPDKFVFFGVKLAKMASKSMKFAKVVLISANGQLLRLRNDVFLVTGRQKMLLFNLNQYSLWGGM